MGQKLPTYPSACQWDNPLWPPGCTPEYVFCTFTGVKWVPNPDYPPPPYYKDPKNGLFVCKQISWNIWQSAAGMYWAEVAYYPGAVFVTQNILDPFARPYQSSTSVPPQKSGVCDFSPNPFGYGGGSHNLVFALDANDMAAALGVGNTGPAFLESCGGSMRFAEEKQGTCVYVKGV